MISVPVKKGDLVTYKAESFRYCRGTRVEGTIEWIKGTTMSVKWLRPRVYHGAYTVITWKGTIVVIIQKGDPRYARVKDYYTHEHDNSNIRGVQVS